MSSNAIHFHFIFFECLGYDCDLERRQEECLSSGAPAVSVPLAVNRALDSMRDEMCSISGSVAAHLVGFNLKMVGAMPTYQ